MNQERPANQTALDKPPGRPPSRPLTNHSGSGRLRLPIGIQTFSEIREGGYYYVDKTPDIETLVTQNKYYFLSRPRRFGKSLLLDTVRCLFEGRKHLFEGLYLHKRWNWQTKHPVIRLSFGSGVMRDRVELDVRIRDQFRIIRNDLGLPPALQTDIAGEFLALIRDAHERYHQAAVVLIDEYDKPILDNILDPNKAKELREGLKNLYSALKDADPHLRMVLLTGVSKFSKVSLFSGLNNLRDITLSPEYATVCGYTDNDIDQVFQPELGSLNRDMIRDWYNGYRWGGQDVTSVYNPFDVLLLLQEQRFGAYWFETATPTFLVDILKERGVFTPALDHLSAKIQLLGQFDVDDISTEGLLFQTGYLTIKDVKEPKPGLQLYTLGFPNLEVESSLNDALLPTLGVNRNDGQTLQLKLLDLLENQDTMGLRAHLQALYASIPHDWYRNNPIAQYEGHYASVFYSHFAALALNITVEDASNHGRVDMAVDYGGHIYLFEFKVVEQLPDGKALAQLIEKGYAEKYRASGKPIHLVGVEFSSEKREIVAFDVLTA
jgi:hypothetical protein